MAEIASALLWMALVVVIYSIFSFIIGVKFNNKKVIRSAQNGVLANAILLTSASIILLYLLGISDFSLEYVAHYTNRDLPMMYKLSAFWAGNSGSLLLWVWILSIYGVILTFSKDPLKSRLKPYASMVVLLIASFFLILLNFDSNPFNRVNFIVQDGAGMNPMLQNIGMLIHPLTQYLGYVGVAIPFAYLIADLLLGLKGEAWIKVVRRWTLFTWLFLTLGMVSGAEWAYVELGWGGYWAWDPVENASLFPWLTITAFLHSLIIQEKKGSFKIWNVVLVMSSFILTIFGTFITRSGILASVHAFAERDTGIYFLIFILVIITASLTLFIWRHQGLKSKKREIALLSKENSFLANNVIQVLTVLAVLFGTIYPLLTDWLIGTQVYLGEEFFNMITIPLWIVMLVLMGFSTLMPWGHLSSNRIKKLFIMPFIFAFLFATVLYFFLEIRNLPALFAITASFFVLEVTVYRFMRDIRISIKGQGKGIFTAIFKLFADNRRRYGGYIVHIAIIMMVLGIAASSTYQDEIEVSLAAGESIQFLDYELAYNGLKHTESDHKTTVFAEVDVRKDGLDYAILRPAQEYFGTPQANNSSARVDFQRKPARDLYMVLAGWDFAGAEATFWIVSNPLIAFLFWGMRVLVIGAIIALWPDDREYYKRLSKDPI
ncbi:heme lyase CcmF/NrfE family subunit [Natronospora cellulosivora (SeqCode)]